MENSINVAGSVCIVLALVSIGAICQGFYYFIILNVDQRVNQLISVSLCLSPRFLLSRDSTDWLKGRYNTLTPPPSPPQRLSLSLSKSLSVCLSVSLPGIPSSHTPPPQPPWPLLAHLIPEAKERQ